MPETAVFDEKMRIIGAAYERFIDTFRSALYLSLILRGKPDKSLKLA